MPFDPSAGPFNFNPAPAERIVYLTRGFTALIDAADWDRVQLYSWHAHFARSNVYARARGTDGKPLYLHRYILGTEGKLLVDHQNRISLDCRRQNLRVCGFDKNAHNAEYTTTTGYRGVTRAGVSFRARIKVLEASLHLGMFPTAEQAARAYDAAAIKHYGAFAWTNFPTDFPEHHPPAPVNMADIPF